MLFKPFADAESAEFELMNKATTALKEIFSVYTKKERAFFNFTKIYIPEIESSMTKANIMTVALNWGNEYNKDALMKGEGWSEQQVDAILKHMEKRDWDTVQALWDHVDSYWPAIEQQERDLNGLPPPKVEVSAVETSFGTYRGGYYPVLFDADRSHRQLKLEEASQVQEMFGGQWARSMTKHGFTKARTNTGGKPLIIQMDGLAQHLSAVIHDLTHRRAVINVSKIISRPAVRESIEGAAGKQIYRELNPWIAAIASDRVQDNASGPAGKFFNRLRMGSTVTNMGWKATTGVVQGSGYTQTIDEIGVEYAMKGIDSIRTYEKIKESWDFISSRSTFMTERPKNHDRDIRDVTKRLGVAGVSPGAKGVVDVYTADKTISYFAHIGLMDMAVSVPSWMGAYSKAMDGKLENIEAGDELAAIDYADSVVRVTQGGGSIKDLARIQRGSDAEKLFTQFYSFFSVQFNRYQEATKRVISDKDYFKFFSTCLWAWFIPAVLDELILGRGPEDDEDFLAWTIKKQIAFPMQGLIGVRDISGGVLGDYGYSMTPAADAGESLVRTLKTPFKDEPLERRDYKNIVMTVGYFGKLPTRQLWNSAEYFYLWNSGEQQPENAMEGLWRGLVIGKDYEQE